MPRQTHMTYVAAQKRWIKKYKGRMYGVSCKQLGTTPGKEASSLAANAWWEKKQAELDAEEPSAPPPLPHPRSDAIVESMQANLGVTFETTEQATAAFHRILLDAALTKEHLPDWFTEAVLGAEKVGRIKAGVAALVGDPVPAERSVGKQVERWLAMLRLSVKQKLMDEGRFDAYRRHVGIFERWLGADSPVEVLTAAKLEEWWGCLASKVAEDAYSPSYAKTIFMTSKQFISRLGELGLIALPGNIRSRRFRFGDGPRPVERLATSEVMTLLAGCDGFSERTGLYILLMLNCGMYQSDISDIGEDEVDFEKGTLSRPRSKTPKGPRVTYKLWPETLALLRKHRAKVGVPNDRGRSRVLLTDEGKPLVRYWLEGDKVRRYDVVQSAFSRLFVKVGMKKPIKLLRKTSASELASHPAFGAYVQHFLAHSPKGVADRHYVQPAQDVFDEALAWLRSRFLASGR